MKKFFRPLSVLVSVGGAALVVWSLMEAAHRGFGINLDGNWDPFIAGASGTIILVLGMTAYFFFGPTEGGARRRGVLSRLSRSAAIALLTIVEGGGMVAAVWAGIIFLRIGGAGQNGLWALGVTVCGIVANRFAAYVLPRVRGPIETSKKQVSVASFSDRDD